MLLYLIKWYFQLDTLCFDQRSYAVREDEGPLVMSLRLSRALPFDVYLKFVYKSYSALGKL